MRLAFVDLLFTWPPHGGACTDLFHTAQGLVRCGHDVHVFMAQVPGMWERAGAEPDTLPSPSTAIQFTHHEFTRQIVPERFREAVDAWKPDAVFVCDAFFLKPYLIEAFAAYPIAARYYAYEASCPRDFRRYLNDARCPKDYVHTPNLCRVCAVQGMVPELKRGHEIAWIQEYLAARAYSPKYYTLLEQSLRHVQAIVVYNEIQKQLLESLNDHIFIVPGGVESAHIAAQPMPQRQNHDRRVILMTGRCEDPVKGMKTLVEAGELLARDRADFEIWATHPDMTLRTDRFKPLGWRSHDDIMDLNRQADICVVPSLWEEPFGMVAVEAMAVGRPVVAARGGGLTAIVEDGVTGLLYDAKDAAALAQCLARLLDTPDECAEMGRKGRERIEREYDWRRIVERAYPPILECLKQ